MTGRGLSRRVLGLAVLGLLAAGCGGLALPLPGRTGGQQAAVPGYRIARDPERPASRLDQDRR